MSCTSSINSDQKSKNKKIDIKNVVYSFMENILSLESISRKDDDFLAGKSKCKCMSAKDAEGKNYNPKGKNIRFVFLQTPPQADKLDQILARARRIDNKDKKQVIWKCWIRVANGIQPMDFSRFMVYWEDRH